MSHLIITDAQGREMKMNVTQFRSPMSAQITSAQTKKMLQHFAIRAGQPDINFTVQYSSLDFKHKFEGFIREHQQIAQDDHKEGMLNLWWPERGIENWTGYIMSYTVTEKRFEVAPSATFGVSLLDSMMSEYTDIVTRGIDLSKILGPQINPYRGYRDLIIIPPSRPNTAQPVNPQDGVLAPPPPLIPTAPPGVGR